MKWIKTSGLGLSTTTVAMAHKSHALSTDWGTNVQLFEYPHRHLHVQPHLHVQREHLTVLVIAVPHLPSEHAALY